MTRSQWHQAELVDLGEGHREPGHFVEAVVGAFLEVAFNVHPGRVEITEIERRRRATVAFDIVPDVVDDGLGAVSAQLIG